MPAIRHEMAETSKVSILRAPLCPAISRDEVASTPQASGVTIPRPVTTTRLMCVLRPRATPATSGTAQRRAPVDLLRTYRVDPPMLDSRCGIDRPADIRSGQLLAC